MITETIWFLQLLLAHLLGDFALQPRSWVNERKVRHFASGKLYLHGLVIGLLSLAAVGPASWLLALFITITHILIDGWKSYRPESFLYFVVDQVLHLLVLLACWLLHFGWPPELQALADSLPQDLRFWKIATAFIFLTSPAGILIGQLTRRWRDKINLAGPADTETLANAGKWIGYAERTIILVFVLMNQYSAIGLLVAAKGIIRFNEKDRQEIKTEYLVVGTLLSICLAVLTGMLAK